jgi:hypothetical protein
MHHFMKAIICLVLSSIALTACGPSAEAIATQTSAASTSIAAAWTKTPTPPPTPTATPKLTDSFTMESYGLSFEVPAGWTVTQQDTQVIMEHGDSVMLLFVFPAEAQARNNNDPIAALTSFIEFSGYALPDEEPLHILEINGSEFAFGAYSNPGESVGFNNPSPLFIAMEFTEEYTLSLEFNTGPGNEQEDRVLFEYVLASLPPSKSTEYVPLPTLIPAASLDLPAAPEGISWQGVENIDFALPMPDGWTSKFINYHETWLNGLQEYDYEYVISPDDLRQVSDPTSSLIVNVTSMDGQDAAETAEIVMTRLESHPAIHRVIDHGVTENYGIVTSFHHGEVTIPEKEDPEHTFYIMTIVDTATNTLYVLNFDSPTATWEEFWATGEVVAQLIAELVQK